VRIDVGETVFWDIDRLSIEAIIERTGLRPSAQMVVGAVISALFGGLVALLLRLF